MPRTKEPTMKPARRLGPALTPEARENQMISYAVDLAEKQLREGTASSQVITHYLRLGTTNARLEKERLELENELIKAKTEAYQSSKKIEALYLDAMKALKEYKGLDSEDADETFIP